MLTQQLTHQHQLDPVLKAVGLDSLKVHPLSSPSVSNVNLRPLQLAMTFTTQDMAYNGCGMKIKNDLLEGSAVVMFAYGGAVRADPSLKAHWFQVLILQRIAVLSN